MEPDLDRLLQEEADAFEAHSQSFIRLSMARNKVQNRLREIREDQPTLFNQEN